MQSAPATATAPRYYRLSLRSPVNLLSIFVAFVLIVVLNLLYHHNTPDSLTRALALGATFIILMSAVTWVNSWLRITPTGFACRLSGRSVGARWQDVERIGPEPTLRLRQIGGEGLLIRKGAATLPIQDPPALRWIPLERFAPNWRESALGDDIRRYAPWLMEEP